MSRLFLDEIAPSNTNNVLLTQGGMSNPIAPSYVGEIKQFRFRRDTSIAFPFWNLSLPDQNISNAIYPDYVSYLKNIKAETCLSSLLLGTVSTSGNSTTITFTNSQTIAVGSLLYFHTTGQFRIIISGSAMTYVIDEPITLISQNVSLIDQTRYGSAFSGGWSGTSFTLNDTAQNRILLESLREDVLYQGAIVSGNLHTPINPTNWITLKWSTTYAYIISFDINTRVININSGVPFGESIEIYPHYIVDSFDARHRQVDDSVLINNGIQIVNGLRLRDRMQGHWHLPPSGATSFYGRGGGGVLRADAANIVNSDWYATGNPTTDGTNGNPRTGQFTRPRGLGVYFYEYMGKINL